MEGLMEDTEPQKIDGYENMECFHESYDHDWLPLYKKRRSESVLAPHPYCYKCGVVRNVGPDRAKKVGYYVEVLSEVKRYLKNEHDKGGKHKLTEAQKRLMVKEMQKDEVFHDLYGNLASAQEDRFVEILQKYRPDLKRCEIEYYLE